MFGIDSSELAVIALVALLVIGPKDLPRVMRQVGQWLAKGRAMTRHVRSGFDTMMREAELEEMQKAWAAQNEAIMKATALPDLGIRNPMPDLGAAMGSDDWTLPPPPLAPEIVDIAPPAAEPEVAPAPKRRRKAAVADHGADTTALPAPRRRTPKKPAAEPEASEAQATES
ncbi:MAG: twin-arginine translocase subunit TatB [Alphaproteobacteria bacterium]|nr:MAG: twin-arginine translocase subunit TatB [Alphaproteobacteria bacterium]